MLEGYADTEDAVHSLVRHIIDGSTLEDTTVMVKKEVEDMSTWTYADGTAFSTFDYFQPSSGGKKHD